MKQKKNFFKSLKLLIVLLFIAGVAYLIYVVKTLPDFQAGTIISKPTNAYLNIFNSSAISKLNADYVLKPKYDSTICRYLYDTDHYVIQEFIINVLKDKPLTDVIEVNNKDELNFKNTFNNQIRCKFFTMSYKTIFPAVNHLKISLFGSPSTTLISNDSTFLIHSIIKNISIKCNGSDTSSIFCQPELSSLPVEVLFLKRKKVTYFVMMSINRADINLEPKSLYKLIKW